MTDQAITHDKPARDSIFGVCAAFASDFGFNPLWLRLMIGAGLMVNMEAALGAYLVLGVIVLISRLASPNTKSVTESGVLTTPEQRMDNVPRVRTA